jgi:hypothetical protein
VVLKGDQPRPSIEEELVPQGQAKDAAARNANLQSFDVAGVDRVDNYDYKIDDNNGIIAVADIPQQPQAAPLAVHEIDADDNIAESDNNDNDAESDDDDRSNNNDYAEREDDESANSAASTNADKSDGNQGVWRSQCKGKGVTKKYANYSLLMAERRARRGGPRWALIRKGCIFFLADNLSNAKPIPKEYREEFALGVALVYYSMNTGIKKLKERVRQE